MSAPDQRTYWLARKGHRAAALDAITRAPDETLVVVKPPTRTLAQNSLLHAMLTEIVASGHEYAGCRRTLDEWKVIFVSAHAVATNRPSELVEGLEGEAVMLRESTAMMSRDRLGSLVDYMAAWCAQHGITLRAER